MALPDRPQQLHAVPSAPFPFPEEKQSTISDITDAVENEIANVPTSTLRQPSKTDLIHGK